MADGDEPPAAADNVRRRGPKMVRAGNAVPPDRLRLTRHARRDHRYSSGWSIPEAKMKLGQPLRFKMVPAEHESLLGFVARATSEHVLLDLNRVLRRAGISMDRPGYLPRLDPATLAGLAPVLGCAVEDVTSRATPVARPEARSSVVSFGAVRLHPRELEIARRRISPIAAANGSPHLDAWLVRTLPYCPFSFELLRSDCSECGSTLGWKKSVGIDRCETCEAVVGPTPAPLLEDALRADYALFANIMLGRTIGQSPASAQLGPELAGIDADILIRTAINLGAFVHLAKRFTDTRELYKLPPTIAAQVVATGTRMLRKWPIGFRDWVAAETSSLRHDEAASDRFQRALSRLGNRFIVGEGQARLVRLALEGHRNTRPRRTKPICETVLICEARKLLGLDTRLLELVDAGHVPVGEGRTRGRPGVTFSRSFLESLRARMDGSTSLPLLSRETGLPTYALDNLCDHDLLTWEGDPAVRYLRHAYSVTNDSINRLFGGRPVPRIDDVPADAEPVGTAARRIGGRLKPWTDIIAAITSGSVTSWIDPSIREDAPFVRRVLVRGADLTQFDAVEISGAGGKIYQPPEECNLTDAGEILNLKSTLSVKLREVFSDELRTRPQRGPTKAISMATVFRTAREEISIAEICARAGWNPRQAKWALRSFERHRTPCGWGRDAIERSGVMSESIAWEIRPHRR